MKKVLAVLSLIIGFSFGSDKLPSWYYSIKNIKLQKEKFFELLTPLIEKENKKIEVERKFIKHFFKEYKHNPILPQNMLDKLLEIAQKYRIKHLYNEEEYLKKVDTIPTSLVLAQAAIESGWGKSRFAREANNFFGEWTYGKKGLIPKRRSKGKKHKIKIFDSIQESIASYMLNLNRHRAYRKFRMARFLAKQRGKKFNGLQAAMTMGKYSGIGKRYNYLVSSIIKRNALHRFEI